jgi:alkylation response protein AidB-like acyl-CoA dehydrogenase
MARCDVAAVLDYDDGAMAFFQVPPVLGNVYSSDRALRSYLSRALPPDVLAAVEPELFAMGELSGHKFWELDQKHRDEEPRLVQWDAWGNRIDRIEITPLWVEAEKVAAEKGVVATAYEKKHGELSRIHQFALAYLFDGSTHVYTCPLAMTDGAAKTLLVHGNRELIERALPRLTSRDPASAWTSGQWMTERTGGSDVATTETVAKKDGDTWRLYGTKWFTSATTSQMALTLARPEGNPPGGHGLALFYVELRDDQGRLRNIQVNRLKDKLGTRMVPTAELTLDGAPAIPVVGLDGGIKNITPMLNVTRTWNSIGACTAMRRGMALALDYAQKRVAFGTPLAEKPLHVDTLAGLQAELEGAMLLAFRLVELLGREENKTITEEETHLLRLLTPIVKATTGKQAVTSASEILETFGGAGYIEDTGLPRLLRDAQVLPIWEGTTNVLSLDLLRAVAKTGSMAPIEREVARRVEGAKEASLAKAGRVALEAVAHARAWLEATAQKGIPALEAGARRFNLTLGRALELALLVDHAAWAASKGDARPAAAARRFARTAVDLIVDEDLAADARALVTA